ncbi:MAG: hypothetical protein R2702_16465 [Acidimicrobiales bacterium]
MLARLRSLDEEGRGWAIAGAVALAVAVALVAAGPGNDLDVANVFRSGRAIARHLSYVPSRPPGSPVHEAIAGVLDLIGGPLLTGLASIAAMGALVVALDRLLADEGLGPNRRWALAVLVANPWAFVAATSTADYVFALRLRGRRRPRLRRDRAVAAGVLFALAMGSRVGSITLLLGVAVAELTDGERAGRRRTLRAGVVAAAGTALLFVPSVAAAGGLDFARNDFAASGPFNLLGRALAKDLLLVGLPSAILVLATAVPALLAALRSWSTSWLVRFAAVGLVASQGLFVRFPWKMAHLLPSLLCLVVLLAIALEARPRVLMALVGLQLLFAVVRVDVIAPDDANEASSVRLRPTIVAGPVVRDWQCRLDHPDAYLGRQIEEVEAAWDCAAPFRD